MKTELLLYYVFCAACCAFCFWLHLANKKRLAELKKLQADMARDNTEREQAWRYTHPVIRGVVRDRMLFDDPIKKHLHAFPNDLQCAWSLVRNQDGFNINCLMPGGDGAIKAWNDASFF
jgi:hypothetical protein